MNNLLRNKRFLTIGICSVALLITAGLVWHFTSVRHYDGSMEIQNLSQYTRGKPSNPDTLNYIKYDLFRVINQNLDSPVAANSVKDVMIRNDSFSQDYDRDKGLHTVKFIIDIASLNQSYQVSYQWVDKPDQERSKDEWGTAVKCLSDKDQKVYPDFQCKDMFTQLDQRDQQDPIQRYLPHSTLYYKIILGTEKKTLRATIYTTAADERTNPEQAIAAYKQEINQWIDSKGLKHTDYKISYTLVRASVY